MPMRSLLRRVISRRSDNASSWQRSQSSGNRRSFNGDLEQENFQYANSHCLSSYYSVFAARLAIMVMLAILIGMLTLLTWHFTRVYTTKSLNSLAYGLRYELLQRPILRMWNILNSTVEIATAQVKLSEYVIRQHSNPPNQAEQVELYTLMKDVTWALFASRRALNSITINYRNGFVQAFHRDRRSGNTFYIYSDLVNYSISGFYDVNMLSTRQGWNDQTIHGNISAIWYREPLDPASGEKIGKAKAIPPDELINIAGISQVPDGAASWHVAVSTSTDSPLLSAALPVWDPANENIVAVVGVTTAFYSVGRLMKELVEFHSGYIYLTTQEGWLIATSSNTPLLMNSTSGPKLMMAADSEDHVIRSGAEWLQNTCGNNFPPNHEVHIENARLENQLYYIDSFFLNLKRLPMVGVLIIPRKYIMGKVDERSFKTFVILISASICILVIGCICIFILTKGVSKEMKLRAELISHLDARRKAEASSNYKSQFLANMSHELRTPMAAVIGLLDILKGDHHLTNEQYTTITQIRKWSNALLRLLNNILDLSKVESGKLVLEEAEFDLGRELEGLVDMFYVQCSNHNVEIILDLSDDMPKLARGDSARVVQIFTNLISNSIKFTNSGYIILRGWCENPNISSTNDSLLSLKESGFITKKKFKQRGIHEQGFSNKDNRMIFWFEVDDTGCGIDPSKWGSVFESFEQADPSTTRLHGGTGLGLCIVRTLVNKMGGEIKVVKKDGPGTLMQLYLLLGTSVESTGQHCQFEFSEHNSMIMLALNGRMSGLIMSRWLRNKGLYAREASDWFELTQVLQELSQTESYAEDWPREYAKNEASSVQDIKSSVFVIVIDIELLDLSTDIWSEQLNFLDKYYGRAKFAWILNQNTSNAIETELRRRGHFLMISKPLHKDKMIQILQAVIKENNLKPKRNMRFLQSEIVEGDVHECVETDPIHMDSEPSNDSDRSENGNSDTVTSYCVEKQREGFARASFSHISAVNNSLIEFTEVHSKEKALKTDETGQKACTAFENMNFQENLNSSCPKEQNLLSYRICDEQKSLEGLRILLAEDTPILQRVATIMLQKMGATVVIVGDGVQAVKALNRADKYQKESPLQDGNTKEETELWDLPPYDLILMDCQMPKMDGYEATRAIRESELGSGLHIPIVALTAHAMSSDEAKCLEVGMDAYLTKPINSKLMISTILSLTRRAN